MKFKDLKYVKINNVNPLCLIFSKVDGYFEELWSKIRDLIKSISKNSDDYDEKYMEIKFNSDDKLPLNKTINILSMIVVVTSIFVENNKFYPQVLLDECLYKL